MRLAGRTLACLALLAPPIGMSLVGAGQASPPPDPIIRAEGTVNVSPHVWVIPDGSVPLVPNVGIVVGSTGVLVVDTGLGVRNGQTVLHEAMKVGRRRKLYVVSTHFHPEHALGEAAFPPDATIVRYRNQQKDIDEFGLALAHAFASRSAAARELLEGAAFRRADILFDRDSTLDLGGVTAHVFGRGATHTRGDTMVFVEGDGVLFAGDVVMNRTFVAFASPYSSVTDWIASLDELRALKPERIVPSHGAMGDGSLIDLDRGYLSALAARVGGLRTAGKPEDEIVQIVGGEFRAKYPDWTAPARIADAAKSAYAGR